MLLLHLQLPRLPVHSAGQMRGKAVMAVEDDRTETKQQNGEFSIVLLLNLLNQPLYLRSVAHLEQVLSFLCVVLLQLVVCYLGAHCRNHEVMGLCHGASRKGQKKKNCPVLLFK